MERFSTVLPLVMLMLGIGLIGCGGGQDGGPTQVLIDGSSTVFPITEAVAEEFMSTHQGVRVNVGLSGTGGGFQRFLRGETDINDASRPIRPEELELAEKNGVEFIELPVAYDGLAVVAHPENDWLSCITTKELEAIWQTGSDINRWNQIRSGFPDRELALYGPGTASGTYDYFTEVITGEAGASRSDYTASEDDNVLVQGVSGDEGALAYFGLAYYQNNSDQLKLIAVNDGNPNNGEGCIKPIAETVEGGTYQPLSRPLFIYVRVESAKKQGVQDFVNFYIDQASELAPQVGYVSLSDSTYEMVRNRFESRITGTMYGESVESGASITELLHESATASE